MLFSNFRRSAIALALAGSLAAYTAAITPDRKATLDRISAQSLQGHLSFLASDLLEGRDTPSRGLDLAATYIASQFRRAGLKPVGDDGYFQTAHFIISDQSLEGAELAVHAGDKDWKVHGTELRILTSGTVDFADATPLKVKLDDVKPESVEGKVIVIALQRRDSLKGLARLKPAMALLAYSSPPREPEETHVLQDAEQRRAFPVIRVHNRDFYKLIEAAKPGLLDAKLSLRLPAPVERKVDLRNVAGLLPGSDPSLANTYVLISAHYDHLGRKPSGDGDVIYNGANDDGSGTVSVIEIASALAAASPRPRRSILFMAYFGEEKGLLGSRYYGRHPLFPLKSTVADLNLEQLGRSDSGNGKHAGTATMTGFGYTDITKAFEMAGAATGVKIYDPEADGDRYFAQSDNQSLADVGVPAHTLLTAFEFPDYHKVSDEWDKIDYANLQKVDRAIALTLLMIADDPQPPHWNESNPHAEKYVKAWRELK